MHGASAVVTNLGQINGAVGIGGGVGIYLPVGGTVTNGLSGAAPGTASIQGYTGVELNAPGTIDNYGTILSAVTGGVAAEFLASALLVNGATNATAALLQGYALGVYAQTGTINNHATIIATGTTSGNYGIYISFSDTVSNLGTASLIEGHGGVKIVNGGTVSNAGTIESNRGAAGVAINFGAGDNRLIVDPGASFVGSIGGGSGTAVMELAAGGGGAIYGFGTSITNFTSIVFDSSAQWIIGGNDLATGLGTLEITGFTAGDTIDLTGFVATSDTFTSGVLVLTNEGGTHATLNVAGDFTSGDFQLSGGAGSGTDIIVCFAKGTRIATPQGERRIELLAPGDRVRTRFGGPTAIQWIGRRQVDCGRHPDPRLAWPVRVAAGAIGPGCPRRDLFLSPNHAVCVLDDLIPIRCLINGGSIAQVPMDDVTYYHIELPDHDMLWAEGLQTESYLDAGDRGNFSNGDGPMRLFPDFATSAAGNAALWETKGCAPLVVSGPRLEAARTWLIKTAGRVWVNDGVNGATHAVAVSDMGGRAARDPSKPPSRGNGPTTRGEPPRSCLASRAGSAA